MEVNLRLGGRYETKQGESRFFTEANDLPFPQVWLAGQNQFVTACRPANLGKNGGAPTLHLRATCLSLSWGFYVSFCKEEAADLLIRTW